MYNREDLVKYEYFDNILEGIRVSDILDPLTGVVRREYITGFAQYLIKNNIPFTYGMVDIDNFKQINDNYGHSTGDEVLSTFSEKLRNYLGDYAVAGRYGGDEFLFINFRDLAYDDKRNFCLGLYSEKGALRGNYKLSSYQPYITGTVGMATFPDDASNYVGLFAKIDKTLYRGKSKGRNCFIIYVKEKHDNIEIVKLKKKAVFTVFKNVANSFEAHKDIYEKMKAVYKDLKDDIGVTDFFYINENKEVKSFVDGKKVGQFDEIDDLVKEVIFSSNNISSLKEQYPVIYKTLSQNEIESLIIAKVSIGVNNLGYLMCAEPHTLRIWQESEYSIMFLIAKMLGGYMVDHNLHFD